MHAVECIIISLVWMKPGNIGNQRILAEIKKLANEKLNYLQAGPLPDDLYTWHFTFQGPENTQFHQGLYHGQILLPFQYPFKPPDIVFMNKNGRFETNTKICLTITQYHPEQWNSAWTIRTMLEAVISLFAENVQGVGSLSSSPDVRRFLAKNSHSYVCQKCGPIKQILAPRGPIEHKQKFTDHKKQQEDVVEQLPRKQSELINQIELPTNTRLFSQKVEIAEEKTKRMAWNRQKSSLRAHQQSYVPEKEAIYPKRGEQGRGEASGPQVILLSGEHAQAKALLKYKESLNTIQRNLRDLKDVFLSAKWS